MIQHTHQPEVTRDSTAPQVEPCAFQRPPTWIRPPEIWRCRVGQAMPLQLGDIIAFTNKCVEATRVGVQIWPFYSFWKEYLLKNACLIIANSQQLRWNRTNKNQGFDGSLCFFPRSFWIWPSNPSGLVQDTKPRFAAWYVLCFWCMPTCTWQLRDHHPHHHPHHQ